MPGDKTLLPQHSEHLERGGDADRTVEAAAARDAVQMRADEERRQVWFEPVEAGKDVAEAVDARRRTKILDYVEE